MTTPPNMSGVMHCWFMAKAEVGDRTYVSLRGVNWDGRYDQAFDFAPQNTPWWHVPTCKLLYNPEHVPSIEEALGKVKLLVAKEWPALKDAEIVSADQNNIGEWGGANEAGCIEAVTRIAFDYGKVTQLPNVIWAPGVALPKPRHPVVWVPADQITKMDHNLQQGRQVSPFVVAAQTLAMEQIDKTLQQVTASNLLLQETVAEMFVQTFGDIFSGPQLRGEVMPSIRPSGPGF